MIIKVKSGTVLLEITNRCYTGCTKDYCYKKMTVSSTGSHISFEVMKQRILWIKLFTDCQAICLLGGEPLLSPYLKQISEYILSHGFHLEIITSGKISKNPVEIRNLEYILDLYEFGRINIDLSYHFRRNQKEYQAIREQLSSRYLVRREYLKKQGRYSEEMYDFISTVVATAGMKRDEFDEYIRIVLADNDWTPEQKPLDEAWMAYVHHFYKGSGVFSFNFMSTDNWRLFRQSIRFFGAKDIFNVSGDFYLSLPESGSCSAANAEIEPESIKLRNLHIRSDGGITFPLPQCIDMPNPFANVDIHVDDKSLYEALTTSLLQVRSHVFLHNRIKAKDNCDENGKEADCIACPFGQTCTPCWKTVRPWQQ